ncbi:hypothetical protein DEF23_10075 [Marinitenerispora sediminis]|uniref:Uncharacterized protein n=2 Tax=Marinitenerispora sediminis TaxID=1931232 RepID=A0A368T8X8_9ACTN|nr:hypothetical protein DEF28_05115 [Marinitenerispora sediminis]RCV57723.1 hypothetical protein DEF23_10075 [Marinitenerispora sediminis]RCV60895.1 hypothetical protein DEF24_05645 [Marinitenerispora sediminis]
MRVQMSRVRVDDILELDLAEPARTGAQVVLRPVGGRTAPLRGRRMRTWVGGRRAYVDLRWEPLTEGTWAVRWSEPGRSSRQMWTDDPCYDLAARREYAARPSRREVAALRAPDGRLLVRVRRVRPYAEVREVEVRDATVRITGFLAHTAPPDTSTAAELLVRQRDRATAFAFPAGLAQEVFRCAVPLPPLARAHAHDRPHNEWDLWLRVPGRERGYRLRALCDDIVGKKGRVAFPTTAVRTDSGAVDLRPYFTAADGLSLLGTGAGPRPPSGGGAED